MDEGNWRRATRSLRRAGASFQWQSRPRGRDDAPTVPLFAPFPPGRRRHHRRPASTCDATSWSCTAGVRTGSHVRPPVTAPGNSRSRRPHMIVPAQERPTLIRPYTTVSLAIPPTSGSRIGHARRARETDRKWRRATRASALAVAGADRSAIPEVRMKQAEDRRRRPALR
jgi:hypothetical protein